MTDSLRDQYLLDPEVVFLNHGSYGACPRPVFEVYQQWQRELERQPVAFFRRIDGLLTTARESLAGYLTTSEGNLVFVMNATTGLNMAIRSLALQPGDEILATDHEYGALVYTWEYVCERTGAIYRRQPIPAPVSDQASVADAFWSAVTPRTRVIFMSHITSPTALILPVAEICRRARQAGILTVIDGAHAPGQVAVDLTALDADFYAGNCHKWLSAPKGAAFLYVRPEHQALIQPLIVSWGWRAGASFTTRHHQLGTRDVSAWLAVPAAIEFQRQHDWPSVRQRCHDLARAARQRLTELTELEPLSPDSPDWFSQMISLPLPPVDATRLSQRLLDDYTIEVPLPCWRDQQLIRLSFQAYNTQRDLDRLIEALIEILPSCGN